MIDIDALLETDGLFQTTFPEGWSFVWRLLSLKEYRTLKGLRDNLGLSEFAVNLKVFERCYVGNYDLLYKNVPVGALISVGGLIMYLSGDCNNETLRNDLAFVRGMYQADSVEEHIKRVIFTAFPSYTPEDLESWSRPELLRKFVVAEQILVARFGTEPFDLDGIKTPEEIQAMAQQEKLPPPIDFDRESKEIQKSLGYWGYQDALDLEHLTKEKAKHQKLDVNQARKLDRMKAARGR